MSKAKIYHLLRKHRLQLSDEDVLQIVCSQYRITIEEIKGGDRSRLFVAARHSACWLIKNLFNYKLQQIADLLKMKNHTSVIHAIESIENLFDSNDELVVNNITAIIEKVNTQNNTNAA